MRGIVPIFSDYVPFLKFQFFPLYRYSEKQFYLALSRPNTQKHNMRNLACSLPNLKKIRELIQC
jgi:hypothetical protein